MDRVTDPADPERCQAPSAGGQCWNKRQFGAVTCETHSRGLTTAFTEDKRLYNLAEVWRRDRLAHLSESDPVFALRQAIALARILHNKLENLVREQPDLFRDHGVLNTLQRVIQRLVKSSTVIENSLTTLKGKSVVLGAGQSIIQVCSEELRSIDNYAEIQKRIENRVLVAIRGATNHLDMEAITLDQVPAKGYRPPEGENLFQINDPQDSARLAELTKNDRIKSLVENTGLQILRIEECWNSCEGDDIRLLQTAGELVDHLKTLEGLVKEAHEIEELLGNLLSPETRQALAQKVSRILVEELKHISGYEQIIDRIKLATVARARQEKIGN